MQPGYIDEYDVEWEKKRKEKYKKNIDEMILIIF